MPKLSIVPQDIAAANVSLQLVQALIDILIKRGAITNEDIKPVIIDLISYYGAPGKPERKQSRDAAAEMLKMIVGKYDTPPKREQH